jgi:hypothetical protein
MSDSLAAAANPLRFALRAFLLFTVIYLCTWAGHYTSGDGSHKIAWAQAMLGDPTIIGPDQNGVYSKYGIGHTLLAVPPVAIAHFIKKKTGIASEAALYTLMFIINGSVFLALVAYYLAHFFPSSAVWGTILIMGLATIWWPYTKLDFSEPLVLTTVFLGFVLIRFGNPILGMTIAGLSMTIRPDSPVILVPLILWYLWANRSIQAVIKVALSLTPSIALVFFANYLRYHSILDHGYADQRFSNLFLVGLNGILLSSGKSIFLYSPPLLLGLWGWKQFAGRNDTRSDAWLFMAICGAQVLFYAKYWYWSSDDAWGDRYVLPGVLFLCIPMVTILHRKALVIPVVAAGVAVQLLAVTVGGLDFLLLLRSSEPQREEVFLGGKNRIDFADVWFNPNYSQIFGNWILLRYLLHVPPAEGTSDDAIEVGTRLYDAIPPRDWNAAAHWDFIWTLRRSAKASKPAQQVAPAPVSGP